jgi:hypothetical protein
MRGTGWLWPAFALAVALDAAILHFLPPVGSEQQIPGPSPLNLVGDLLVAGFANLFLVAAVAPWLARRLAARPAAPGQVAPPFEVHMGRAAAALMACGAVGMTVVGLGNRPLIVSETKATETNARMVRDYVMSRGTPEMRRNLETANTARLSSDFFRTCIAADDRRRAFCFFGDTKADPPTIKRDPDTRPNSLAVGR